MEIPISQDIRKYKTKDIGNFSFKEAGYIALALGTGILTYKAFNWSFDLCIIPIGIILIIGFFKPFGMSVIQFFRTVMKENLSPIVYIYETDFEYNPEEFYELYGDEYYKEETVFSDEWNVQNQPSVNNKLTPNERIKVIF